MKLMKIYYYYDIASSHNYHYGVSQHTAGYVAIAT